MDYELSRIDSETVNLDEKTYQITTRTEVESLCNSINTVGLIVPPVIACRGDRKVVISGFRRIQACRKLKLTEFPACIFPEGVPAAILAPIAIVDNAFQRDLNCIEISRCLNLLAHITPDEHELCRMADTSGFPSNIDYIRRMLPLCKLSGAIQEGLIEESIALSTAFRLAEMEVASADVFAKMLKILRPSLRVQLELIETVCEIARRKNLTPIQILEAPSVDGVLIDTDLDRNQKIRKLRDLFTAMRFPKLTSARSRFGERLKQLKLGSNIQLLPPKNFEGQEFTLQVRFKTKKELEAQHQKVGTVLNHPLLADILKKYD